MFRSLMREGSALMSMAVDEVGKLNDVAGKIASDFKKPKKNRHSHNFFSRKYATK